MPTPRLPVPHTLTRAVIAALVALSVTAAPAAADDAVFTPAPDIPLGDGAVANAITVGDFNSDGRHDLAVSDFNRGRVAIRLGNGDGSFKEAGDVTVKNPVDVSVGDFNGDGVEDLVVAGRTAPDTGAAVFKGVGDGQFAETASFVLPDKAHARGVSVGDFNADGNEDLSIASLGNVAVRLGKGDGTFLTGPDAPLPQRQPQLALPGDFDGDGFEDLAVTL